MYGAWSNGDHRSCTTNRYMVPGTDPATILNDLNPAQLAASRSLQVQERCGDEVLEELLKLSEVETWESRRSRWPPRPYGV